MRESKYDHQVIEKKWQERWDRDGLYQTDLDHPKKKFYNLIMFPYPSAAALHVGHVYCYGGADTYARYKRMQGYDVFEPMGFDAFGIHAENYAITIKEHPQVVVPRNVEHFREDQMKKLGAMFDWSREVNTTDPDYYKWTQWVFLQMHRAGLVERKVAAVDWCPSCKTVLANEQVIDGECERCHSVVEQKELAQWFFKITKYADRLLAGLDTIDWPERTKSLQKHWIGKKTGANIHYPVVGRSDTTITVFTTRPDTNLGATFVVLAPEHPLVSLLTSPEQKAAVNAYQKEVSKRSEMERTELSREKTGVFTGAYCCNPLTGQEMPVWVADFVLSHFGTGAVVGVPAHDERDFAFAKKFGLAIRKVVDFPHELHMVVDAPSVGSSFLSEVKKLGVYTMDYPGGTRYGLVATEEKAALLVSLVQGHLTSDSVFAECDGVYSGIITREGAITDTARIKTFADTHAISSDLIWVFAPDAYPFCYQGHGITVNSDLLNGLETPTAIETVNAHLEKNKWGEATVSYRLHDWCVSRQRYWGPPIPMIHCEACAQAAKPRALLIHGMQGRGDRHYQPWLKAQLEAQGYEVVSPTLPDADQPDYSIRMKFLESEYGDYLTPQTVIVGHSNGAVAALHLAEKYHLHQLVLVAPYVTVPEHHRKLNEDDFGEATEAFHAYIERPVDFAAVGRHVTSVDVLFGAKDKFCGQEMQDYLSANLTNVHFATYAAYGHFTRDSDNPDPLEPAEILQTIDQPGLAMAGWHPVPERDLPVLLPKIDEYLPDGSGRGPLARVESFIKTECPVCHGPAERETDVSDTFLDSAWYQLRYPSTEFGDRPFDDERSKKWLPVDMYIGGIEHATMHLIYFRFVTMVLHDLGYFDFEEPALKLRHQGLIIKDGAKMSKSRGNVVNPDEYITRYGADAFRTYMLFIGPYEEGGEFNDRGILGASRFFEKIWDVLLTPSPPDAEVLRPPNPSFEMPQDMPSQGGKHYPPDKGELKGVGLAKLHATVKKVGEDLENLQFNTAIAALMELGNWLRETRGSLSADQWGEITSTVPRLLAPFAPHFAEELWEQLGYTYSIHDQPFPSFDAAALVESSFTLTVQVNGKVRDTFSLPLDVTQADAEKAALAREKVKKWLEGTQVRKVIYVPKKLINIVV